MKKYIITAATIMAINNSPTNAHGEVTTGDALTDKADNPDQGAEIRGERNEQAKVISQASGAARGSSGPIVERGRSASDAYHLAGSILIEEHDD